MTITADNQFEIQCGVTMGAGTSYRVLFDGFQGLGAPAFRVSDMPFGVQRPGYAIGPEQLDSRPFAIPLLVAEGTQTATLTAWMALKASFIPAKDISYSLTTSGEKTFSFRIPGLPVTTMRAYGRARGIPDEEMGPGGKWITGTGLFLATDPALYDESATAVSADSSSPIPLPNAGNYPTRRCTLTVAGNDGTPVITNPASLEVGSITFNQVLATGQSYSIDLYTQRVTRGGNDANAEVDPSSRWFELQPGANNVTFTGCASVAASYRSAWI